MMKYILILTIIFVNICNAQLLKSYGFKLGLTNSSEEWKYTNKELGDFKMDSKLGLNVSGFVEFFDLSFVSLIAEIGYDQKGMEDNVVITTSNNTEGTGEYKTITNSVDYLDFSMSLKLNYQMPGLTPYIFAGPRMDLLVAKNVGRGHKIIYDDYEKVVYGLKFGFGSEIGNIFPVSLLAEFQYNYDLSNPYKTDLLKIDNNSYEFKIGIIL